MSCFWTNKRGVVEFCDGADDAPAYAEPRVVEGYNPSHILVIYIKPACGPCFGQPDEPGCDPVALTSATVVSGTAYVDGESGCGLTFHCATKETGEACPDVGTYCDCSAGTPVLCGLGFDTEAAVDSWLIGSIELEPMTDAAGRSGLGLLLGDLQSGGGALPNYVELTVNTNVGDGFTWIVAMHTCI